MPTLDLIITDAGRAALVDAQNTGTLPLQLTEVALGTGRWSPDASATALQAEIKRVATVGGQSVADDTLHVTITDASADAYALGEFGLYTDTGVLFAIYSNPDGITDKATDAMLLEAIDIQVISIPAGSVTVGPTDFINPPATEQVPGVARIATTAEVAAGTDDATIVTPKKLTAWGQAKSAILTALAGMALTANRIIYSTGPDSFDSSPLTAWARTLLDDGDAPTARNTIGLGSVANYPVATQAEAEAGTANNRYMTPLRTKEALATHADRTDNPHGVTKSQVGLGSVANYPVATQTEAEAGTANNRYMTPLRAAQLLATHSHDDRYLKNSGGHLTGPLVVEGDNATSHSPRLVVGADKDAGQTDIAAEVRGNTDGSAVDYSDTNDSPDTVWAVLGDGTTLIGYPKLATNGFAVGHQYRLDVNGAARVGSLETAGPVSADQVTYTRATLLAESTDLDTVLTSGAYTVKIPGNAPNGASQWIYLEVVRHANYADYCLQRAVEMTSDSPSMWVRVRAAGVWKPWAEVWNGNSFDPDTKASLSGAEFTAKIKVASASPAYELEETDSGDIARLIVSGGKAYLQGPEASWLRLSGYGGTDLGGVDVRVGGAYHGLWHAGNFNPASKADAAHNHDGAYDPAGTAAAKVAAHESNGAHDRVKFANKEATSYTDDGSLYFDHSEGLYLYSNVSRGGAWPGGSDAFLVWDAGNVSAGAHITITGGVGTDSGPIVIAVDTTTLDAATLDGFDASDFENAGAVAAHEGGADPHTQYIQKGSDANLASAHLAGGDSLSWESGTNWITSNDGGGNVQIRFGHKHDGDEVFAHAGTAFYVGGNVDSAAGALSLKVAANGGAGTGEAVTWGKELKVEADALSWGGNAIWDADNFDPVTKADAGHNHDGAYDPAGTAAAAVAAHEGGADPHSQYVKKTGDTTLTGNYKTTGYLHGDGGLYVGTDGGGDARVHFYDDNSNTWRTLRWDDSANSLYMEDDTGVSRRVLLQGAGQVNQSSLKTSIGYIDSTKDGHYVLPGGQYGFYPQTRSMVSGYAGSILPVWAHWGTISTSFVTNIALEANMGAQQRFIQASPPYDLGDGEIPLFVFALVDDATGAIEAVYSAPEAPWHYNGPTNIMADVYEAGKAYRARKDMSAVPFTLEQAMSDPGMLAEYNAAFQSASIYHEEITQAIKQADMPLVPHPFINNDLTAKTVIMLDPVSDLTWQLAESAKLHDQFRLNDLLIDGYLVVDNVPITRAGPPGVMSTAFRWRNTR